ncbi:MAG: PEP-CTERM sorting domain-containing protein [Bryobacterales bacterium]|nr:PEP-CTERM sorting domain-containing protein [Bryobacterales bacterium]
MLALRNLLLPPLLALSLQAATFSLNTGTGDWKVTQTFGTANSAAGVGAVGSAATHSAVALTGALPVASNLPGLEAFAWINPFGGAVWIGQLSTDGQFSNGGSITCGSPCGAIAGTYIYTLTFDGSLGGSLTLNGFTGDNRVRSLSVVQTNGSTLYSCTSAGPGALCAAAQNQITASTGLLNFGSASGGLVTITALVENLDGPGRNPSGFILSGSATVNDPTSGSVPEPSTYALTLAGAAGLLAANARRRRTSR